MSVGSFKSLPKTQQTLSRPSGSSRAISPGEHRVILHIDPLIPRGDSPTEKSVKSPLLSPTGLGMPKKSNISPPLHLPTVDDPVKTSLEAKSKSATNFIANFAHHDVSLTQL